MFHCPLFVWINKIINKYQKWAGDVIYFLLTMKAHLLISSTHSWNVTYNIYTGTSSTWFSCWVHCQASLIRKKTLPTLWTPTKPHINSMIKQVSLQAAGQTKTNTGGFSALRRMSPLTDFLYTSHACSLSSWQYRNVYTLNPPTHTHTHREKLVSDFE